MTEVNLKLKYFIHSQGLVRISGCREVFKSLTFLTITSGFVRSLANKVSSFKTFLYVVFRLKKVIFILLGSGKGRVSMRRRCRTNLEKAWNNPLFLQPQI